MTTTLAPHRCPECGCFTRVFEGDPELRDPERPECGGAVFLYSDCRVCGGHPVVIGEAVS